MTRKCVVCNKLYIKGSDETFHSFPKDEVRKKLWLKACKIKLCLPSNKICGDHFLPKHYSHSGYLLKNAVPFLASTSTDIQPLDYEGTSSPCSSLMKSSCIESIVSTSKDVEPLDYPMMNCTITYSPCQSPKRKIFNANTIGVLSPSHFSSPRNAKRHLDMVKCKFKEKQVQNSNLKKQIKRLKQKIEKDQEYIQSLNRLLKEREHKEILNPNTIEVLSPSQLSSAAQTKRFLDMKKNKFKEKQIQNENLKNQIRRSKCYTVQIDHDYI